MANFFFRPCTDFFLPQSLQIAGDADGHGTDDRNDDCCNFPKESYDKTDIVGKSHWSTVLAKEGRAAPARRNHKREIVMVGPAAERPTNLLHDLHLQSVLVLMNAAGHAAGHSRRRRAPQSRLENPPTLL